MAENKNESPPVQEKSIPDASKKTWIERQVEKIAGGQEGMQPFIKACLSIAGFIGGFAAGYFVFGREKEKKLHEQELQIAELKQRSREQEKEIARMTKELEESKTKNMKNAGKLMKEGEKQQAISGLLPLRSTERSYLD